MESINVYDLMSRNYWDMYDDLKAGGHIEYWLSGGRGSLKSTFASEAIIVGMLCDKQANAIIYRQVGNTIKDSIYAQMVWAIDKLGITKLCKFRTYPFEITFIPTGQRILFRGADDPLKSKSIKLSKGYFKFLWFEELAEFHSMEDIRTIKQSVLRGTGTNDAFTILSYNPPRSSQSWVNFEVLRTVPTRYVHHSTYLDVPPEWLGNIFLREAEALKESNPLAYENEYLGKVTGNGGNVFENVEVRDITQDDINNLAYFYQGIDWGWFPDPFQWVRVAFDYKKRTLYILDEYRANKTGNKETYESIKKRLNYAEPLTADSAEPKSIGDYKSYGAYWIHPVVKGPGSVDYSMKWLASLSKIVIDSKCDNCKFEFISYEYQRNKEGQFLQGYPDANNHCIDAVRYATYQIWKRKGD